MTQIVPRLLLGKVVLIWFCAATFSFGQLPDKTDIDRYVEQEDSAYQWEIVKQTEVEGGQVVVIEMTSQEWLTPEEVNRTAWQHWLTMVVPTECVSNTGLLMISGGKNGGQAPSGPSQEVLQISKATQAVVAELKMVPNQPLIFHDDGVPRVEDDLIAYTWDQFIKTGESRWLARNAMIKSAVRAMDTMTAVTERIRPDQPVESFVVAGASKRGWTTWLTGAIDDRVVAIIPIVIDVLNTDKSMRHHFAAYGYWAPAIGNYVQHHIMERMDNERLQAAFELVDPFYYRHRLGMPKLILNAAGDQFFLPDSSRFYWDELIGEKNLRYVPNTDHGMDGSDALETVVAFFWSVVNGKKRPHVTWTHAENHSIRVTTDTRPVEARLWQATNSAARDFRLETLGPRYESHVLKASTDGVFEAEVDVPDQGWKAYFVELTFDVGAPVPFKVTTDIRVVPDKLPYVDRDPTGQPSVTLRCRFADDASAQKASERIVQLVASEAPGLKMQATQDNRTVYFNWSPNDARSEVGQLEKWLGEVQCQKMNIQLESGQNITTSKEPK